MERPIHHACRGRCHPSALRRDHHDRLLRVESEHDALLELFEVAVTWNELQYPAEVIPPGEWLEFAHRHRWRDPAHVLRIFSLATDIARPVLSAAAR